MYLRVLWATVGKYAAAWKHCFQVLITVPVGQFMILGKIIPGDSL